MYEFILPNNSFSRNCCFQISSLFRSLLICDVMLLGILDHKPPEFHYALVNKELAKTIANGTIRIIASACLSVCHPSYHLLPPSRSLASRLNAIVFPFATDDTNRRLTIWWLYEMPYLAKQQFIWRGVYVRRLALLKRVVT